MGSYKHTTLVSPPTLGGMEVAGITNALGEAVLLTQWIVCTTIDGLDLQRASRLVQVKVPQSRGTRLGARVNPASKVFLARLAVAWPEASAVGRILWNMT